MIRLLVLVCLMFLMGCSKPPKYELYKSGEVESIEYLNGGWATSDKTIIRFTDKTTLLLADGAYQAPFRRINVYKAVDNCKKGLYSDYKIEEVK